jgi:hypothetical protein
MGKFIQAMPARVCPDSPEIILTVDTNRFLDLTLMRTGFKIQEYGPWRSCSIPGIYHTIKPFILASDICQIKPRLIKHDAEAASAFHGVHPR